MAMAAFTCIKYSVFALTPKTQCSLAYSDCGKVEWPEPLEPFSFDSVNTASLFHSFNHLLVKVGVVIFAHI